MKKSTITKLFTAILAAGLFLAPVSSVQVQAAKLTAEQKQERSYANKFARWCRNQANKINNADPNKKLTISTGTAGYTAFNGDVFEALKARPDVQITVKWKSEGQDLKFIIRPGTDVTQLFDESGYAGFAYLQNYLGENGNSKAAKAIRTVDTTEAAALAAQRKLEQAVAVADIDEIASELLKQSYEYTLTQGLDETTGMLTAKAALPGLLTQLGFDAEDAVIAAETAVLPEAKTEEVTAPAPPAPIATAAPAATATGSLAEQLAQQAFAQYVAAGMTTEQALAATQAALPELLKLAGL